MRQYRALFAAQARTLFQYRTAAFAGLMTQWVFGYVMICVLAAFYRQTSVEQPMALSQAITYTWLGQAMLGMLPWNIDNKAGQSVRTGEVAYDLARPLGLYAHWYARVLAMRTVPTLLKAVPMFLIATFIMPGSLALQWPAPVSVLAWGLSLVGVLVLSCAVTLFMQSTLFWTVSGDGITRIFPHITTILSGMVIPLPLFPDWMQGFLKAQPFAGLVSLPNEIFCESLAPSAVWGVLALQLGWAAVFVLMGRVLVWRGLRRLTVAGG